MSAIVKQRLQLRHIYPKCLSDINESLTGQIYLRENFSKTTFTHCH